MLLKAITLCTLFPAVFSIQGLPLNDMFPYGSSANDQSLNIHNQFAQASLLDFYAPLTIPNNFPAFKIYGVDLGRSVFVSVPIYFLFIFNIILRRKNNFLNLTFWLH